MLEYRSPQHLGRQNTRPGQLETDTSSATWRASAAGDTAGARLFSLDANISRFLLQSEYLADARLTSENESVSNSVVFFVLSG